MTQGKRFKQVVEFIKDKTGKNLKRICQEVGISYNMLAQYNTGRSNPKQSTIELLALKFGANPDYIISGTGEPFQESSTELSAVPDNEAAEITKYLADIPVYETPAYANTGTILPLNYYATDKKYFMLKFPVTDKEHFGALRVTGESMNELNITTGDYIVFNKKAKPNDGDTIVAQLNGQFLVKMYDKNKNQLKSADSITEPIKEEMDDNCYFVGTVVSIHRFN